MTRQDYDWEVQGLVIILLAGVIWWIWATTP